MWGQTARYPDFFGLDARAIIPFCLWLFHWSMWTFYIAIGGMLFFWFALRRGDTPISLLRKFANRLFRGNRGHLETSIHRRKLRW